MIASVVEAPVDERDVAIIALFNVSAIAVRPADSQTYFLACQGFAAYNSMI
jgi:hypothetical protein